MTTLRDIETPTEQDVLFGRGGGTNHHAGNKRWRQMVADREIEYYQCKRLEKPVIALEIVQAVRASGGRFLKKNESTGLYDDVGDRKAREKTSQALRERAPEIKKQFDAAGGEGCKTDKSSEDADSDHFGGKASPREVESDFGAEETVERLPSEMIEPLPADHVASWSGIAIDDFTDDMFSSDRLPPVDLNVKRETSHQYETMETRPDLIGESVKRMALNRDNSRAANRLKQQYIPGYETLDPDMRQLSMQFESSTSLQPERLSQRLTTIDQAAMALMAEPTSPTAPMLPGGGGPASRTATSEALMFDLDDNDPLFQLGKGESEDPMPEPSALANEQKQTTLDIIVEDLTAKPVQMSMANASRSNTIAQLDIDLNNDEPLPEPDPANRVSTDDLLADPSEQFEIAV